MIINEVKIFERSTADSKDRKEAMDLLTKDIHHFIAFFKTNIVDYDVSYNSFKDDDVLIFSAMVVLRHEKVMDQETSW